MNYNIKGICIRSCGQLRRALFWCFCIQRCGSSGRVSLCKKRQKDFVLLPGSADKTAAQKSNIVPKQGAKKRLCTYTYTYTQRKSRVCNVFIHFMPIFGFIHIHIHIHTKEIANLRYFHAFQADFSHYTHTHTHTHKNIARIRGCRQCPLSCYHSAFSIRISIIWFTLHCCCSAIRRSFS